MSVDASVDVAIVGCGLIGAPLALALANAGFKVTTIDRLVPEAPVEDPLDQRCTALSASTVALLQGLGLWEPVEKQATAIESVHISQRGYFGVTRLTAAEQQLSALGYVVENRRYQRILQQQLAQSSVTQLMPAQLNSLQVGASEARLGITAGDTGVTQTECLHAKLVVAADGLSSSVRELAGIGSTHVDYEQSALLTTVQLEQSHNNVAFERFTKDGPLALLPSYDRTASVVCCLSQAFAKEISQYSDDDVLHYLQQQFGRRLGPFVRLGSRKLIPLVRIEANRQIENRLVLLGNAARLLHPVAGQGYNLAMRDVATLISCLNINDAGTKSNLEKFASDCAKDQRQVIQLTDTLARLFRGNTSLLGHARGLGLLGLDTISPLRQQFAHRALGYQS